jgi:SAM-dependent methyltransferase
MKQLLKSLVKYAVPKVVLTKLIAIRSDRKIKRAIRIFQRAPETPMWLGKDIMDALQKKYATPLANNDYYAEQNIELRGNKRALEIISLIPDAPEKVNNFLEIGCWDGMVSCCLQRMGKITTAIDNNSAGFDVKAVQEGVTLKQMDAAHLQFENESFDFVFSYDAFEHIADPELAIQEAIRVVKKGGYIYFGFGPLYMSPLGLHAYNLITVPYCHVLFPKEVLNDFVNTRQLGIIDYGQLNGWTLDDYRNLWDKYSGNLKRISYKEIRYYADIDLIMKYPSCFKSKTKNFDNYIVSAIEVMFRKIT